MKKLILVAALAATFAAHAEITPPKGAADSRVRVVDYNRANVVRLATFYGVSTHIQFGDDETITSIAAGDDQAWRIVDRGNNLFIKPLAKEADTNVTVVTNKRTYQFALVVQPRKLKDATAWADPNLIYSLSFRYPEEEAEKAASVARQAEVKSRLGDLKSKLKATSKDGDNTDYWVSGSESISPTAARDDGRFIYLTFSNNRDMPAVYSVDDAGNEALINTNVIDGNTIVVQRLVPRLVLRKGQAVAAVVNKSFDLNAGNDNKTGTVSDDVERVVKGSK